MGEPTGTVGLTLQEFIVTKTTVRESAWTELGPLHVCDSPLVWSLSNASKSESRI